MGVRYRLESQADSPKNRHRPLSKEWQAKKPELFKKHVNNQPGLDSNVRNGTSFAAPQIAGLVADMKALDPSLTPAQIEGILVQSATPQPGKEALVGAGVVNREKALAIVQDGLATPSP